MDSPHISLMNVALVVKLRIGEVALVLRAGLDDKHQSTRDAALQALVSLVCPPNGRYTSARPARCSIANDLQRRHTGDTILRSLEVVHRGNELLPLLKPNSSSVAKPSEFEDDEAQQQTIESDIAAAQADVLNGLVTRTHLLPRLRYLLEVVYSLESEPLILNLVLQSAVRSPDLIEHVAQCPRLIGVLVSSIQRATPAAPLATQVLTAICRASKHACLAVFESDLTVLDGASVSAMALVNRVLLAPIPSGDASAIALYHELLLLLRVVASYGFEWKQREQLEATLVSQLVAPTADADSDTKGKRLLDDATLKLLNAGLLVCEAWAVQHKLSTAALDAVLRLCGMLSQDVATLGTSAPCAMLLALGSALHTLAASAAAVRSSIDAHGHFVESVFAGMSLVLRLALQTSTRDSEALPMVQFERHFYRAPLEPLFTTISAIRHCLLGFLRVARMILQQQPQQQALELLLRAMPLDTLTAAMSAALFDDIRVPPMRIDRFRIYQLRLRWFVLRSVLQLRQLLAHTAPPTPNDAVNEFRAYALLVSSAPQGEESAVLEGIESVLLSPERLLAITRGALQPFEDTLRRLCTMLKRFYALNLAPEDGAYVPGSLLQQHLLTLRVAPVLRLSKGLAEQQYAESSSSMFLATESTLPHGTQWLHLPTALLLKGKNMLEAWDEHIASQATELLHASLLWISAMQRASLDGDVEAPVPSVLDQGDAERARLLAELMKIFVLPGQFYAHEAIGSLLGTILRRMEIERHTLPMVEAVGERFESLLADVLDEYGANSFADALFTRVLLVFLRMDQPVALRSLVWNRLDYNINALVPHDYDPTATGDIAPPAFLRPIERDFAHLRTLAAALASSKVQAQRNAFVHSLALHHVASYIFDASDESLWLRQQLLLSLGKVQ